MAKKIGLKQLVQKKYINVEGMDEALKRSFGELEDAFDMIIYGDSGNGKSNMVVKFVEALIKSLNCRCEYIAYEEGHGKTIRDTMIGRHNMLEEVGNKLAIVDHYTYEELDKEMGKKKSAKVWVIDSIDDSQLTTEQVRFLKQKYVLSRKKKIMIFISWSDGKKPKSSVGKAIEYRANIKVMVQGFVGFPKCRFGGNKPFIIWEEGAKNYWGAAKYNKYAGVKPKPKHEKPKEEEVPISLEQPQ